VAARLWCADRAVAVLEPLLDTEGCPCRVETAFLLGVVRLAQALPHGMRRRAAADAFAAAGGNPVYSPKAAVWLTEHFARAGKWDKITGIGTMINFEYGRSSCTTILSSVSNWRRCGATSYWTT
jgi:hypothetical protein